MRIGEPSTIQTIDNVVQSLLTMRSYKPYKYGGDWFVAIDPTGQGVAFRSLRSLQSHMAKFPNLGDSISYAKVGKQ